MRRKNNLVDLAGMLFLATALFLTGVFNSPAGAIEFHPNQIPTIENGKLQDMGSYTIKMRDDVATGDPEDVKVSALAEELTPASGDWLLCETAAGVLSKCNVANVTPDTDTNTNADTLCTGLQSLRGDGTCVVPDTDTNTNASTVCIGSQSLRGDGTCVIPAPDGSDVWHEVGSGGGEPAFENSWVNYGAGFATAAFHKVGDTVFIRGFVKSGSPATSSVFTLPVGYRPSAIISFSVPSTAVTRLDIHSGGLVNIGTGGSATYTSITVSFSIK